MDDGHSVTRELLDALLGRNEPEPEIGAAGIHALAARAGSKGKVARRKAARVAKLSRKVNR